MTLADTRVPLQGSWSAPPAGDQLIGPASGLSTVPITVTLQSQDPAGLAAQVTAVSTPGSPEYRRFLTPGQFAARFGASHATITAVSQALRNEGLAVGSVAATGLSLAARGTVAQLNAAFSTSILAYREPNGVRGYDASSSLSMPAAIAPDVMGVIGLDTVDHPVPLDVSGLRPTQGVAVGRTAATPSVASAPTPSASCSSAISGVSGAYSANQLAQAYSLGPLYQAGNEGAGTTVALVELQGSGYLTSDLATFANCYGISLGSNQVNFVGVGGATNTPTLSSGVFHETELDIETVLSLAPKATIEVYVGTGPTYDTLSQVVSNDTAKIVSMSFGLCDLYRSAGYLESEYLLFQAAALEGQSLFAAAGDQGAQDCLSNPVAVPVGTRPVGQVFDANASTGTLYVADNGSSAVSVGSATAGPTATVMTPYPPNALALDATNQKVFVADGNGTNSALTVISTAGCNVTTTTTCSSPATISASGLDDPQALAVNGSTLYVGNANGTVSVVDAATNAPVATLTLPTGAVPSAIAIAPSGEVYVSDSANGTVDYFDGSTCNATTTSGCSSTPAPISLTSGYSAPEAMVYDPTDGDLFVAVQQGFCIVSTTTNATLGCSSLGGPGVALGLSPSGGQVLEVLDAANTGAPAVGTNSALLLAINPTTYRFQLTPLFASGQQTSDQLTSVVSIPSLDEVMITDASANEDVMLNLSPAAEDPADQPDVTGVGGTSLTALGPAPTESVWNNGSVGNGAGGGGISKFAMPTYQQPLAVIAGESSGLPCGATSGYCREVPDVSADADPLTGYACYFDGQWVAQGGTSAATPLWAAVLADISSADENTAGYGLVNPALYHLAQTAPGVYFNDVTTGNNDYLGTNGGLYPALPGYDMATGLGTPIASKLVTGLATAPGAPTSVTAVPGDGSATVSWVAPVSDGGEPITSYTATATDETASGNGGQHCTVTATSCTLTGLHNGDLYTFSVTASNQVGTGPASAASVAVTPSGPTSSGGGPAPSPFAPITTTTTTTKKTATPPPSSPAPVAPAFFPPPPPGIPPASFGAAKTGTASTTRATTVADAVGRVSAILDVPAGALPAGTTVSVRSVVNAHAINSLIPAGVAYVTSFAVSWVTRGGSTPPAQVPLSMTITDPAIVAGDVVYVVTPTGAFVKVGVATTNGRVTITFSSDPDFVVARAPKLALTSKLGTLKDLRVAVPLRCVTGRSCRGTARLSVVRIALRQGRRSKVHVVLAEAAFRIAEGHHVALELKMTRAGASIFSHAQRSHRHFRATLLTRLTNGGRMVAPVYLKLPRSRPHA